jgi:probable rRNA maturation factor
MNDDPDSRCSLRIEATVRDPAWRRVLPDVEALAAQAAMAALSNASHAKILPPGAVEAALILADDALSRELNHRYRGRDNPTNVLSFPAVDAGTWPRAVGQAGDAPPLLLGDIVIARQTTQREAREQGKAIGDHLRHLVVHGTLHLLGYDHHEEPAASEMERLETEILATLGVADPYLSDPVGDPRAETWRPAS